MNPRPTPSPLLAAIAAAFSVTLAACGGGNAEAPPVGPQAPQVAAAPVVTITNDITGELATGPILFSFSFNRDVGTTFTAEDVTVTGGTKGAFTRTSGTRATLVVVPTPNTTGTVQVTVGAGAVTDALGAPNVATSAQKAFDTVPPVVRTGLVSFQEGTPPRLIGFGGAEDATVVTDPTDGANKVARVVKNATAEPWAGTTVSVCPNDGIQVLPFTSTLTTISARVWSPVAGIPVRMKVEDSTDPNKSVETEATVTVASGWQTLNFNFAIPATGTAALNLATTYDKASIFFNFGTPGSSTGARTYFFDDVSFVGSTFTAACRAAVGGGGAGSATVLADFDTINTPVLGFEGAEGSAIENGPAGGGSGRSFKVLRSGGQTFAGALIDVAVPLTATMRTISAQVNAPAAGVRMVMKLEGPGGAASAEVVANETVVAGWQTLTWTFSETDAARTYNRIVLLPNLGTVDAPPGRSYFFDSIALVAAPAASPGTLVADFDSINTPVLGFEGAEGSAIENGPAGGGSGRSFKVLRSGGQTFAGALVDVAVPVSATRQTISAQVNSPAAGVRMVMKLEGPGGAASAEVAANETVVAGWQTLTWTFSAADVARTYNRIVLLPNLGTVDAPPGRAYYFDTITVLGGAAAGGGGGGGGGGAFAGTWASDYQGDLFVNARSELGGEIGFFFDERLVATKAYDYAGVSGIAQNPGGVPNFYFGFGLNPPAITDAFFGAYVKAPGNGVANVSSFTRLKVNVWGPDQLFRAGSFPTLRLVLQGPPRAGCSSPSGGSEVQTDFATTSQGAAAVYTLTLANFTIAHACNGETSVAQVLSAVTQMNILLLNRNIQYTNRDPDGVAFTNGLNVGRLTFE